jgi:putative hydrolase of the HAD superfamily
MMDIKGILFDSGDTLVYPKSGSWWPGPAFEPILLQHGINVSKFESNNMRIALEEGQEYLDANHLVANLEEEIAQFRTYYQIICNQLGINKSVRLTKELARAHVEECNFILYPDTVPALETLTKDGKTLGVIADAWPSLHNKYIALGIRQYFKSFIISSEVGCCKPDEQIYRRGIDEIGIESKNLLFVDDDTENVKAAIRLGMNGIVMLRNRGIEEGEVPFAMDMHDILKILA